MSQPDLTDTDAPKLGKLIQMSDCWNVVWSKEDLAPMLHHQLESPIEFDLSRLDPEMVNRLRLSTSAKGLLLKSFSELLHHPRPPLELLSLTKDFAKAARNHPESPLPHEIASVLYFACIGVALVRCGQKISELSDEQLLDAFTWVCEQSWVDESTKSLFSEAREALQSGAGA